MWSDWLVFCECGFQSACPLIEKDKRLMEFSWWERLTEGEIGSCSDGWGHVQQIFNPIFCWWVELGFLLVIYLGPNYGGGNKDNAKRHAKECSNYHTIALISQASKVMLKILQARHQQYWTVKFQMFKLDLEKAEEPKIKLPMSVGS